MIKVNLLHIKTFVLTALIVFSVTAFVRSDDGVQPDVGTALPKSVKRTYVQLIQNHPMVLDKGEKVKFRGLFCWAGPDSSLFAPESRSQQYPVLGTLTINDDNRASLLIEIYDFNGKRVKKNIYAITGNRTSKFLKMISEAGFWDASFEPIPENYVGFLQIIEGKRDNQIHWTVSRHYAGTGESFSQKLKRYQLSQIGGFLMSNELPQEKEYR